MNWYYIEELKTKSIVQSGAEIALFENYETARNEANLLTEHYKEKTNDGKSPLLFTVRRT